MKSRTIIMVSMMLLALLLFGCLQQQPSTDTNTGLTPSGDVQKVSLRALNTGLYDQQVVRVVAGTPVEFSFSADPGSGCGRQVLIPAFSVNLVSRAGETQTATFTPVTTGTYDMYCPMRMFRGTLLVEARP